MEFETRMKLTRSVFWFKPEAYSNSCFGSEPSVPKSFCFGTRISFYSVLFDFFAQPTYHISKLYTIPFNDFLLSLERFSSSSWIEIEANKQKQTTIKKYE